MASGDGDGAGGAPRSEAGGGRRRVGRGAAEADRGAEEEGGRRRASKNIEEREKWKKNTTRIEKVSPVFCFVLELVTIDEGCLRGWMKMMR